MLIKKKASQVLEFLRSQTQQIGNARLLGMKVLLSDKLEVADKVCTHISQKEMSYDAHMKSDCESILSLWYKYLVPYVDSKIDSTENLAEEVVALFRSQKKKKGSIQLLSIKVMLPEGADTDRISNYIVENYLEYKARFKNLDQGKYPVVAIGYKE